MTQFSLSALMLAVPGYPQAHPLARLHQDWQAGLWSAIDGPVDGIVVLDDVGVPLGYLSLAVLGALVRHRETVLSDYVQRLEPLVQVPEDASLTSVWAELRRTPQQRLVVVDAAGTYLGLLCPYRLLQAGLQEPAGGDPHDDPSQRERRWLVELGHALKSPLASLLGLSTLLLDERLGSLNPRQQRYGELIQQTVRQLVRLVHQLLDWMRLESDQLVLHPETIKLDSFSQALVSTYGSHCGQPEAQPQWQAQFSWQRQPDLTTVVADPLRLRQILHYLIDYGWAEQVTPTQLHIEAWGRWVVFNLNFDDCTPPTAVWRQETELHLNYLQLVLAQGLLERHGGDLVVIPGQGHTQFTALLPQVVATAIPAPLVLLVTTSIPVVTTVMAQLGPGSGVGVVVADGWDLAGDLVRRLRPRLVLEPLLPLALPPGMEEAAAFHHHLTQAGVPVVGLGQAAAPLPQGATMATIVDLTATTWARDLRQLLVRGPDAADLGPTLLHLRLREVPSPQPSLAEMSFDWAAGLNQHKGRLLVAETVPQAVALSRVWQPLAVLLDGEAEQSASALAAVATSPLLRTYPLITLTPAVTAAALAIEGLTVVSGMDLSAHSPGQAVALLLQRLDQRGMAQPAD